MADDPIVVIGAGQAGLQIADSLRRGGYAGPLTLIGDEASLPYQRPPLSKQYIGDELAPERLLFRPADYYTKQSIEIITGVAVEAIESGQKSLSFGGETRRYAKLALATGASVRKLPVPGADLPGVRYLRSLDDAANIRRRLRAGPARVVAIGGGFIGLEIAASARQLGHDVTVVEALDRLMARAVSPFVSAYYADLHRQHGVDVLLGTTVTAIEAGADDSLGVVLGDGRILAADMVVVGIGSVPNTRLAEAAGLECANGIVVDEFARTSAPDIVAAGDCTFHRNVRYATSQRLESVQNAVDQAKVAAATLLGEAKAYDQVPWFWSDQYDAKLQMVGTSAAHDRYVLRGDPAAGSFSAFYFLGDALVGVDSVNRPADHLVSRKLLALGTVVPEEMITDTEQNLKTLL
jgi:3-phenylpropionate/trans-cinnamate dioxygenase ferredoxin reductase subunit